MFSWQSVDIPILISYYITKSSTFDFEVFGGPYISIPISALDYENKIVVTSSKVKGSISEADDSYTYTITNKVIPGIEAGTSIAFKIGKATKCIMDVLYITDLTPVTINDNSKLLYRRGLNCNVGLLFSF